MSLFSDILRPFKWLAGVFVSHTVSAAPVAITITEAIKTILANPITGFLENVADAITGTQVPTSIANAINGIIPKILAVELSIQGLPPNPTEAQILAFEQQILTAFNIKSNNSKLYTELGAQIYGIIQTTEATGNTNFAGWVSAIEQAYLDLQKDLSANAVVNVPVPTPAPIPNLQPSQAPIQN